MIAATEGSVPVMPDSAELARLLSLVTYDSRLKYVDGLQPFRSMLRAEPDDSVLRFLTRALVGLEGEVKGGVAFVIAEHYLATGSLLALERLFATDEADVKASVLGGLWGEPPASSPEMGPGVVALALEATAHSAPNVRAAACSAIQNQCAWGVDVSPTCGALLSLLGDPDGNVRMQAACAVGNLAKRKYDVSLHVSALQRNLSDQVSYVRAYSAWALWQLSRSRHDIGRAVPELVRLLASRDTEDDNSRKSAAGALLHHGGKSAENRQRVRQAVESADLDRSRKGVRRFEDQLAHLEQDA